MITLTRRVAALAVAAVAALAPLGLATAAQAASSAPGAFTPGCRTVIRHIHVNSGSVPIELGGQKVTFVMCWNSAGVISSSSASADYWVSAAGAGYSWTWTGETIYARQSTGDAVQWVLPFHGQGCVPTHPLCTPNLEYQTAVYNIAPRVYGPVVWDRNIGKWASVCMNTPCKGDRIDITA